MQIIQKQLISPPFVNIIVYLDVPEGGPQKEGLKDLSICALLWLRSFEGQSFVSKGHACKDTIVHNFFRGKVSRPLGPFRL